MTISQRDATREPSGVQPRRPLMISGIICFILVTFGAAGALVALQQTLGLDLIIIEIVQLAPTIGVLAVLLLSLLLRRTGWTGSSAAAASATPGMVVATVAPIVIMIAATVGYSLTTGAAELTSPTDLAAPLGLILIAQLLGTCAEEFGWRGYLQPTLERRIGLVPAAIVVGLLWGAWHVQIFSLGLIYVAGFLLSTVAMSIIMAVLVERLTWAKTLVAGVFHFVMNIGMLFALSEEAGDASSQLWIGAACAVAAVGFLIFRLKTRSVDRRR